MRYGAEPFRSAISTPSRSASMRSTPRWAKSWHRWAPGAQSSRRFAASTVAGRPSSCAGCRSGAKREGFAAAEVQISEAETPLHRLETVYRRLTERLSTADTHQGALRSILDNWFYALEEDVLAEGGVAEGAAAALLAQTTDLMELRLASVARHAPAFATALRAYRRAVADNDRTTAEALLAWIGGQPNVGAAAKRYAGVKGDLDHFGALSFLQGLLVILRDSGFSGLVVVLDEVETLQRVRSDVREKSLNALRQVIDEIDSGRFPGLYLVITGTPAFFEGPQGVQRLPPLAQRLAVDFSGAPRFDNPRAPQVRLHNFDLPRLQDVGRKIRDLYAEGATAPARVLERADDAYLSRLARAVTGGLGRTSRHRPARLPQEAGPGRARSDRPAPGLRSAARLCPHPDRRGTDRRRT